MGAVGLVCVCKPVVLPWLAATIATPMVRVRKSPQPAAQDQLLAAQTGVPKESWWGANPPTSMVLLPCPCWDPPASFVHGTEMIKQL